MKVHVFSSLTAFATALLLAPSAFGFCRATTCDPLKPADNCQFDSNNACLITGIPLAWRSSCVTIGVQQMGSPRNNLSFDDIAPVVEEAFAAWMAADCGSGQPSIDVKLIGPIECGVSEYNQKAGNTNVVIFSEGPWLHTGAGNAIGITTTRFDKDTGDLWDGDIELNADGTSFSIGDPVTGADLLSVLTHEAGHFLGLAHSPDETATMKTVYVPSADGISFRSLADDDIAGICSIYPPGRKAPTASCENRHGFSEQCGADQPPQEDESEGCSIAAPGHSVSRADGALGLLALLAAAGGGRLARRRRVV